MTQLINESFKTNEYSCKVLFDFINNTLNPLQDINNSFMFFYKRLLTIAVYYEYMVSSVHTYEFFSRIKLNKLTEEHTIPDLVFCSNAITFYIFAYTLIEILDFTIKENYPKDKEVIYKTASKYNKLKNEIKVIRDRFVHAGEDRTKGKKNIYNWSIDKRTAINLGEPDGGEERNFVIIPQSSFIDNQSIKYILTPRKHLNQIKIMLEEIGKEFEKDFADLKEQYKDKYCMI